MPIIPRVGRKTARMRLLFALMHLVLALGALTMLYPFLLMLGTSITSSTDTNEFRVIPRYLSDNNALFAKYVDDKYAGDLERINLLYRTDFKRLSDVTLPTNLNTLDSRNILHFWQFHHADTPIDQLEAGFRGYGVHVGNLTLTWRSYLRERFQNDIKALNRSHHEEHQSFETVSPPIERLTARNWSLGTSQKERDFLEWKRTLPKNWLIEAGLDVLFAHYLKEEAPHYGGDIRKVAKVWGGIRSFAEITIPSHPPTNPQARADWESFVRRFVPFRYLILPTALPEYRAFLKVRYPSYPKLDRAYDSLKNANGEYDLPNPLPSNGRITQDWGEFISKAVPIAKVSLKEPDSNFRRVFTSEVYNAIRCHYNTYSITDLSTIAKMNAPYYLADARYVLDNALHLRRNYITHNYNLVIDYLLLHGRALWVTILFCLAMILTTLTVNPLCAYALSRYRLPYAYNVLLFLLATMAFPAEVAMIPNFLLLKELGFLNTYWALILPGAASGFSIFLLKGFFDSLPRDLYEAGMIDGASEARMFLTITLPLARPIFAVIALEAFTASYGAFMFALIICQDPKMWTIMVWLYQLQINHAQYINMAALTIASLPTLLVFIFAQNVILRGILLPTEK